VKLVGDASWAHDLGLLGLRIGSVRHGQLYDPNGGDQPGR
jgi:hypothetical protein